MEWRGLPSGCDDILFSQNHKRLDKFLTDLSGETCMVLKEQLRELIRKALCVFRVTICDLRKSIENKEIPVQ